MRTTNGPTHRVACMRLKIALHCQKITFFHLRTRDSISQSVGLSIGRSVHQSVSQSVHPSVGPPLDHMFSPPGGKKPPVPSNFFQFICMDHHCITCNLPHCDLLSAQMTYLIGVFGGLLDRSIFYLSLCMAHISACIKANLKNYMRSGKIFSRASIWDQPGLPRSICLDVTVERRQI